ncbi:OVARIAN TUMOR DOMAIN-containing deubiquitinating enzyme 1 [Trichoderma asperellum]|uniref:ubiquitinyl hydrolase 1 n=1 Tax=Trichoderma asperellum TaxID=101201 RepID=A0A6V8R1T8_TRIAP|nr:OVARIAN TUMOR DOMAIN-containing deubiquitinating enzyme 1 [Trichoderma asperellum]
MFQAQPTPYSGSSYSPFPYGIAAAAPHSLDFLFPTGGAGAGGASSGGCFYPPYSSSSPQPALQQHQHQHQQQFPLRQRLNRSGSPVIKMEDQDPSLHDMAAQQAAAERFQPGLEGPFVGDKTPSDAITQEYAKADPALPQTYSHYRQIKGDGNCGWRAIAFAYYEKLIDLGDQAQIEGEVARLMSLGSMLSNIGRYEYHEDFAEEAHSLLRDLAANIANPGLARVILLQRFNDDTVEANIIYYFRMLAATYLKGNANIYDPFVADHGGIAAYCSQAIDIVNREIEHLGIVGLANLLLKPIDFVLEVAYLDRSPGSQVNRYRFPEEANEQDPAALGPTIYLLYRPDHYDILYRTPPIQAPSTLPSSSVDLQVNRVSSLTNNIAINAAPGSTAGFPGANMDLLSMLPGFSLNSLGSMNTMPDISPMTPPMASPVDDHFVSSQPPSSWTTPFPEPLPSQVPQQQPPPSFPPVVSPAPMTPSTSMTPSPTMMNATSIRSNSSSSSSHLSGLISNVRPADHTPGYRIVFNPFQLEYDESRTTTVREPIDQAPRSTTFKNSVWNKAHYGNPDFHPEEYVPEDDHSDGRGGGRKRRKDS